MTRSELVEEGKLLVGWLFTGVVVPLVLGGVVLSVVSDDSLGPGLALGAAGILMAGFGWYYYRRARGTWGVSLRHMIGHHPVKPSLTQGKFLAGTATTTVFGVAMVIMGLLSIVN